MCLSDCRVGAAFTAAHLIPRDEVWDDRKGHPYANGFGQPDT